MNYVFKPEGITTGLVVVIIQTLMYVNAKAIFPAAYVPTAQSMMLAYMIMTFAFTIVAGKLPPAVQEPALTGIPSFLVSFFLFATVLSVLPKTLTVTGKMFEIIPTSFAVALPIALLYAFVVGYTEELIFRGVLSRPLTDIGTNVLFGIYHYWAYGGEWYSIIIAMVFGFIFSMIRDKFGLMGSNGAHTAWNLRMLGAF